MDFRLLLAYLLCPLAGPITFALLPLLGRGTLDPMWMAGFTVFVAGISYPVTVLIGYPALYFLVKRRERRWWIYVGTSFAIGLATSLLFGPLGGFVVMAASLNGLAFWVIGVKANPRLNTDAQQAGFAACSAGQGRR